MLNLGITIYIKSETHSVWENGIIQNVVNFYRLLENTKRYNVVILNLNEKIVDFSKLPWKENIQIKNISECIDDIDVLFMMGAQIPQHLIKKLRSHNGKLVNYYCGNHYLIEMENCLFKNNESANNYFEPNLDGLWMIPQIFDTNQYYMGLLHKTEAKSIPFIWDSYFIDQVKPQLKDGGFYKPSDKPKRISTFEPNLNVCKFAMYPILIYEDFYRNSELKDQIEFMSVTNTVNLKKNKEFNAIVKHFDIVKNHKIYFEARFKTPWFLSEHTDIVIEHQWENALNYLYLDVAYMEYPLIHNAHLVSDLGYYYKDWDVKKGSELIEYVLKHHDNNRDEYTYNTNKVLDRYRANNTESMETYIKLINDLFL